MSNLPVRDFAAADAAFNNLCILRSTKKGAYTPETGYDGGHIMEVTVDIRSSRIGSQQAVPISKHEPWEK
jgi:hypothetical protein